MTDWREVEGPKIWASRFPRFLDIVSFGWNCVGKKIDFIHASQYRLEFVDADLSPKSIFFARHDKIPSGLKDAFKIKDGLRVISPALRDVLVQFDMDGVQLFEVPIHADETGAPSGLPNHYVLNIYGGKDALIPELSENIEKPIIRAAGYTEPLPNAKWTAVHSTDIVALKAEALQGADLWRDPEYRSTFFFSDRLKQAIDAAGLKTKALSFAPTRIFEKA